MRRETSIFSSELFKHDILSKHFTIKYNISITYLNAGISISPCIGFFNILFLHVKRKSFLTFNLIVYCDTCSYRIFQFEFIVYFTKFKISNPIVGWCQGSSDFANLASKYKYPNPSIYEIRHFL